MRSKFHFRWKGCLIVPAALLALLVILYLSITAFPGFGAQGADFLRGIIGDKSTAQLEMFMFSVQDSIHQVEYQLGLVKASAPWQVASTAPIDLPLPTASTTPIPATPTSAPLATTPTLAATRTTSPPTLTPEPTPWTLAPIAALGSLNGEGDWSPYIQDGGGKTLAFRTFLQPDPKRPYTLVAVVAFDLTRTRLGFVLGTLEPSVKGVPVTPRSGTIPAADFQPGVLLATFSGGFKGEHGAYGAMSDGVEALPPKPGLATVAMYTGGQVKIGEWGKDVLPSDKLVFYRQNCRLIIQDGKINPLVYVDSAEYWGANLNGATVTWRSGLAISANGKTLYFIAGPSMTASVLANVMMSIGVRAGMQLDINNYWVHFVAILDDSGKMVPDPLFPVDMRFDADRYLKPYSRDFFYIALEAP
jgi:hypothetical protein